MREHSLDAWRRLRRRDLLAAAILLGYGLLAAAIQLGASVAGQGLDPVWAAARQRGALRVAVDIGYYPFSSLDGGQPAGYDIDLAAALAAKLGLRAEFVASNLDSIYDDLSNRRADMAASALPYAPEQGWRAGFSTFYFNAGQAQLAGARVGVPLGSDADTYARGLAAGDPSIVVRAGYDTPAEVLADLRRGALDAAIVDNAAALIDLGHRPGLTTAGPALTLEPYALGFAADAFQLRDAVNHALEQLRQEGFFERNGRKWFVEAPEQR